MLRIQGIPVVTSSSSRNPRWGQKLLPGFARTAALPKLGSEEQLSLKPHSQTCHKPGPILLPLGPFTRYFFPLSQLTVSFFLSLTKLYIYHALVASFF